MTKSTPPPHLRPSGADPVSALGGAALRSWIVLLSSGMLIYELLAMTVRWRTWSRARGRQRLIFAGWIGALIAHVAYEWVAEDVGRAAAEAL